MVPAELEGPLHQQDALRLGGDREEVHGVVVGAVQLAEEAVVRGVEDAVWEAWTQVVDHVAWEVAREVPLQALEVELDSDVVVVLLV